MSTSETSQRAPTYSEIAAHAYEIYVREGRPAGRDFDHWLAAERQLIAERIKPVPALTAAMRLLPAPKTTPVVNPAAITSRNLRAAGHPSAARAR
jgi:hypothetical protein